MESWNKIAVHIRRVWIGIAARVGLKKTGLKRLRHEVKTCEYEDVRVLWEMLNKAEADIAAGGSPPPADAMKGERKVCSLFEWARACRKI